MKQQNDDRTYKDPVCGMEVSRKTAAAECTHLGKTFYFCADTCRATFEAEPERYLRSHRQHGSDRN